PLRDISPLTTSTRNSSLCCEAPITPEITQGHDSWCSCIFKSTGSRAVLEVWALILNHHRPRRRSRKPSRPASNNRSSVFHWIIPLLSCPQPISLFRAFQIRFWRGSVTLTGFSETPMVVSVDDYCVLCGRAFSSVALSATSTTSSWDPAPKFDVTRIDSGGPQRCTAPGDTATSSGQTETRGSEMTASLESETTTAKSQQQKESRDERDETSEEIRSKLISFGSKGLESRAAEAYITNCTSLVILRQQG
ncbi:hypothetical protein C8J56DRAFT_473868, partial [Mycena floridula]